MRRGWPSVTSVVSGIICCNWSAVTEMLCVHQRTVSGNTAVVVSRMQTQTDKKKCSRMSREDDQRKHALGWDDQRQVRAEEDLQDEKTLSRQEDLCLRNDSNQMSMQFKEKNNVSNAFDDKTWWATLHPLLWHFSCPNSQAEFSISRFRRRLVSME